ncbi:hypothetical protein [Sphingomonas sp. PAMC 26605]|uniref:hypothetical protein n=1 Tax=Sphingomonas sp. PAMC 26605 TaxID=1112214 RepID=UPI0002DB0536|nr:hypothetical protein [Sphingomonas sp. PAMC 26605]
MDRTGPARQDWLARNLETPLFPRELDTRADAVALCERLVDMGVSSRGPPWNSAMRLVRMIMLARQTDDTQMPRKRSAIASDVRSSGCLQAL